MLDRIRHYPGIGLRIGVRGTGKQPYLHAQFEPCARCGTYLLRRTSTGQVYCPLCEQP